MRIQSSTAQMSSRGALYALYVNWIPWGRWVKDRVLDVWITIRDEYVPVLLHGVTPKSSQDAYRAGAGAAIVGVVALISPSGIGVLVAGLAGWALVILRLHELGVHEQIKEYAHVLSPVADSGCALEASDDVLIEDVFPKRYQTAWATVTIRQGSPVISDSSGVISSIQYRGLGDYTINWVKPFKDEHYGFWVSTPSGNMKYELTRTGARLLMSPEAGMSVDVIRITMFAIQELDAG